MTLSEIEQRERLTRLEEKIDHVVKIQADHLSRWDRQWDKIDQIRDQQLSMKPLLESFKTLSDDLDCAKSDILTIKTEKKVWHKIMYPITGMLSAIMVHLFETKLK